MLGNIVKIVQFSSLAIKYWPLINKTIKYVETFKNLSGQEKKEKQWKSSLKALIFLLLMKKTKNT